MGCWANSEKL